MVCGASGLGKSNFIEFMLKQVNFEEATELLKNEPKNDRDHSLNRLTQQIKGYTLNKPFETSETELSFTIYDSPGYGSSTHSDFEKWLRTITKHIKSAHVKHHNAEQATRKLHAQDPVMCHRKLR